LLADLSLMDGPADSHAEALVDLNAIAGNVAALR